MIFPYLEFFSAFFKVFHDISSPWAPCHRVGSIMQLSQYYQQNYKK